LFSRHARSVVLLLYETPDAVKHGWHIELDPEQHRTGDIWHVWLQGLGPGQAYGWHVDGPYQPREGMRYNRHRLLLDPYATALACTERWDFDKARGFDPDSPLGDLSFWCKDNEPWMSRCLVTSEEFDWQGDRPLRHRWSDTLIYETHVRGFTIHPSAGTAQPGTFPGLIEKIPYLKMLGITAIELMPVQDFNERELWQSNPVNGEKLRNYWGYSTVAFFAPKESYSSRVSPGSQVAEFKTMVRELHRAGIEIILDIAFNHTAEGDEWGATLNFRGLDNPIYYLLNDDRHSYRNFTGCGNTLNGNHPVVRDYILDCLLYWVNEMHVDGFRFDLAAVLERDENGKPLPNAPLLERIAEDPILRDVKLIAEPWDAAGIYQVGRFPGRRWSEWNGRYRDDVRRFWRGDQGLTGALASRLCGSADLYQQSGKMPLNSINFITSHDGFTLNDLVSYANKHNEANGENNHDGTDINYSANYGVEGPCKVPAIESLRKRQIKNMLATLMLSRGVPMLLGGDEFRRTQYGNNNAYCQDNETSWYDWRLLERNQELFRFTRLLIALRKHFPILSEERFYRDIEISWLGADGNLPEWDGPEGILGCHIHSPQEP
ncbi:MAG: glycogen debranching protein GlgX, partial [Gammaproteobacteria bacterium]